MSSNRYDERLKNRRDDKHIGKNVKLRLMAEAERARFAAKMNGEKPKIHIHVGWASKADIFTYEAFMWDVWVTFPFKVPKEKKPMFEELVQDAFEKVFCT
jgi:hypothetical protein